ncbi:phage tail protein [Escherichia sp. 20412-1]|uniref:phage tail protein n=1 Tax=Escherichia sp. 20412-1 TaxID=2137853 RepID=UPI002158AF75|nr:phage tail protein [Escherichia sp. 20412-1]
MRKISNITSYVDENDEFTDGDIAAGVKPTPLLALWFNVIQRELVKVVESAGLTLDPTDDTQLWQALSEYFASSTDMKTAIGALGTMASQNSDAVNVTRGKIEGAELIGDLQGNAATATRLQTAHTINGVTFDGTSDITISSGMSQSTADTRYVQNVRLGSETSVLMPYAGKVSITGQVISALSIAGEVDNSADYAYFRPVQININGTWATVSQL